MASPVRWAFVGASAIADEFVAPALAAARGGELAAIVSASEERGRRFADRHRVERVYRRIEDLLDERDGFDAAYVSTANDSHLLFVRAIAEAGRHVLCEKPLAVNVDEARAAVRICEREGVLLATNHHLRAALAHRRVRELIRDRAIGLPRLIQITHTFDLAQAELRWRGSREQGGGAVLDASVHDADLVRFLLGAEISRVSAQALELDVTGGAVEDGVAGWMSTDAGVHVSFTDAFQQGVVPSELVVHGTKGVLAVTRAMEQRGPRTLTIRRRGSGEEREEVHEQDPYEVTLEAFHAALRGEGRPLATGADGAAALCVADAIRRSAAASGTIVAVE